LANQLSPILFVVLIPYRIRASTKHCIVASPFPAATAALSGVDPLHLGLLPSTLPDVVSRCSSWLVPGLVASENVVGAFMYEFVADQVLGISGLINLSNIVFLVAFSVRDVLKLPKSSSDCLQRLSALPAIP
jgi:hypothetical protein